MRTFDDIQSLLETHEGDQKSEENQPSSEIEVKEDISSSKSTMIAEFVNDDQPWPVGYKFSPTDDQLIHFYLRDKILGNPLPLDIIEEIDLYNADPEQLPIDEFKGRTEGEAFYFTQTQTTQTTKAGKGLPKITTDIGFWKATGPEAEINHEGEVIGFKKTFVFYRGKGSAGKRTPWVVQEFRVNPSLFPEAEHDEILKTTLEKCVVCRIRNKSKSKNKYMWKIPSRRNKH